MLEMNLEGKYYVPGADLNIFQHTERVPTSDFDKDNMIWLFEKCKETNNIPATDVREFITAFFDTCGVEQPFLCGWNAAQFDLPFMVEKGYLNPPDRDAANKVIGDYHYRIFDIQTCADLASTLLDKPKVMILEEAPHTGPYMDTPPRQRHDGLSDCYNQLAVLNGIIHMLENKGA